MKKAFFMKNILILNFLFIITNCAFGQKITIQTTSGEKAYNAIELDSIVLKPHLADLLYDHFDSDLFQNGWYLLPPTQDTVKFEVVNSMLQIKDGNYTENGTGQAGITKRLSEAIYLDFENFSFEFSYNKRNSYSSEIMEIGFLDNDRNKIISFDFDTYNNKISYYLPTFTGKKDLYITSEALNGKIFLRKIKDTVYTYFNTSLLKTDTINLPYSISVTNIYIKYYSYSSQHYSYKDDQFDYVKVRKLP